MLNSTKRISVLLYEKQIDFLRNLFKIIEKEGHKGIQGFFNACLGDYALGYIPEM